MKRSIYIIFVFLFQFAFGQDVNKSGIAFRDLTYEKALEASRKEGKLVYAHGYTSWCHYCTYMSDSVYPDSAVGAFYNTNFICIKIDLEKEGAELNKVLKAHTFPTLLFFDSKGEVVHRAVGRHYKSTFMELGKEAIDPRRQLRSWINIYNNGNVSADTAYQTIRKMETAGMETQPSLLLYLNRLKPEQISNPENWKIIKELYKDVNAPFMQTMISKKPELEKKYSAKEVNNKLIAIYSFEFFMRNRQLDTLGYDKLKENIKASKLDIGNMICDYADLNRMKASSRYNDYFKAAPHFISQYCMNDTKLLNEVSQVFYERTIDSLLLFKAEGWIRRSIELEDTYSSNVLLCGILIQQKKKIEASKVALHAIELAGQKNINNRTILLMMEKIEQMN